MSSACSKARLDIVYYTARICITQQLCASCAQVISQNDRPEEADAEFVYAMRRIGITSASRCSAALSRATVARVIASRIGSIESRA